MFFFLSIPWIFLSFDFTSSFSKQKSYVREEKYFYKLNVKIAELLIKLS